MQVYSSVINAWKTALETMENLVDGRPQAVNNGSALLALSTWHLYPDIIVSSSSSAEVYMNDPMIAAGGVLTLGLLKPDTIEGRGVHWSLSLAHLRHYGHPIRKEKSFGYDPARLTIPELFQAALGSRLGK